VIIKISTDGKFLIVGKLNFANNNVSISGRLYADLSHVSEGSVTVLFLADVPDQVRLLTLYGKLKMGFRNSSGSEVTFDVADQTATAASTTPTVSLVSPGTDGGTVDVNTFGGEATKYLDVSYRPATGSTLDYASILDTNQEFTLNEGGTPTAPSVSGDRTVTSGKPTPIVTVTGADGSVGTAVLVAEHSGATEDIYYNDPLQSGNPKVIVATASDFSPQLNGDALMIAAMQKLGTTRFRYFIGTADPAFGVTRLTFAAGVFKNSDVTSSSGTIAGAGNVATTLTYTVQGATAAPVDPGAGGSVDINTLNDRNWITVTFTPPTNRTIDVNSITDLDPEFTLTGPGIGTAQLDSTRAPICTTDGTSHVVTCTYWITGRFAAPVAPAVTPPPVTLTYLRGSWSLVDNFLTSLSVSAGTIANGAVPSTVTTLTVTIPTTLAGLPTGYTLDPASVVLASFGGTTTANGLQLATGSTTYQPPTPSGGSQPPTITTTWHIYLDITHQVTQVDATHFTVPVVVTFDNTAVPSFSLDTPVSISLVAHGTSWFAPAIVSGAGNGTATSGTPTSLSACASGNTDAQCAVTVPDDAHTFIDVHFNPAAGDLFPSTLTGTNQFTVGGFGGSGVTVLQAPIALGDNTFRFLLTGSFRPGLATLTFTPANFGGTPARGPPPAYTFGESFSVVGATADLIHTIPGVGAAATQVVALGGSSIGRDTINALHYLEITFRPSSGFAIDPASINGDEVQLRDSTGTLIPLSAPIRQDLTTTYHYGFSTNLAPGLYTVTFAAGSFGDTGGILNQLDTETFTVGDPTAALANPTAGQILTNDDFNGRGYVDVTFKPFTKASGTVAPVDRATILDSAPEITLTTSTGLTLVVDPTPVFISSTSTGDTFRYFFTGQTGGDVQVSYIDNSWANTAGIAWNQTDVGASAVAFDTTSQATIATRTWFDVTYTGVAGAAPDPSTIGGDEFTLSGANAQALTFVAVYQVGPNTFRYAYTGSLTTGTVTVNFLAGGWHDAQGNLSVASTQTFKLIAPAQSFFIELSGGITLEAAGLTSEPLLSLTADVMLEIDTNRHLFTLTFDGELSIIKLGTVGATSGRFVLDTGSGFSGIPQLWGVASLQTNFSGLQPYGLFLDASGNLQINTTGQEHTESITLKGVGPGGTDLTQTYVLAPDSFSLQLVGQARIRVPGTTTDLVRLQGGFYLRIEASATPTFELYATASLSFGVGSAQINYGSATGLLLIGTDGIAGQLTISSGGSVGLPDVGNLFSATGTVTVMFNTTLHDKTFTIPASFLPLLNPGDPTSITIYGAAPTLSGQRNPNAPPGGEIYVMATIDAHLSIGGVLTLDGFISITAAVDPTAGAYLKIDGAVGGQVPFLGSLTGVLDLAVFVGGSTGTGVVGRIQLTRDSSVIPGIVLDGQFLLEINTFTTTQTIQTFAVNTKTIGSAQVFDGFQHDAAGNLVVTTQTIGVTAGFKLEMSGLLIIGGRLNVQGSVEFRIELGGADPGIELIVNGSVALDPIGHLTLTDSGFRIDAAGLVARVDLSLGADFGSGIGLGFSVGAVLAINTTGAPQTLGTSLVAPGFLLRIQGSVNFLNFANGSGFVEITLSQTGFQLLFGVSFDLGGLQFNANGGAAVITDPSDPGLVLVLNISAQANATIFSISATGTLQLNTTHTTRLGVAGQSFVLALTGHIELLKILKFDASITVVVGGLAGTGHWFFDASASIDFFGIATLSGHVHLTDTGDFTVSLNGRMVLGSDDYGIVGEFSIFVQSLHRSDGTYRFELSGSASVKVRAFGITVGGVSVGFDFVVDTATAGPDGRVKIELSVHISVDFGLFSIGGTVHITLGYLQLPPPVWMASNGAVNGGFKRQWNSGDSDLYLNAGADAASRNIAVSDPDESFLIQQIAGNSSSATIKVTAFGRSNTYEHVQRIFGNFGGGDNNVTIDPSVQIPVSITVGDSTNQNVISDGGSGTDTLTGGEGVDYIFATGGGTKTITGNGGNDVIRHTGNGTATIHGNGGNDQLFGGNGTDQLYGDDGNDILTGPASVFDGGADNDTVIATIDGTQAPTLTGGTGDDKLYLSLSDNPDSLTISRASAGVLTLGLNGTDRTASGFEHFFVDGRAGADTFLVNDLGTDSGLTELTIDLGQRHTVVGTTTVTNSQGFSQEVPNDVVSDDNAGDRVTIEGSGVADTFLLTYDNLRTSQPANEVKVARTGSGGAYNIWIDHEIRAQGDAVVIDGNGGDDVLNASALGTNGSPSTDRIAVTLNGGADNDTLKGTPFADVLDGGAGNDRVTGGFGLDTFADTGGGADTLVETFDLYDMGLYNDTFVVGAVSSNGVDFNSGTVEDLHGIFDHAELTGGASTNNTFLIGDGDGSLAIGSTHRNVSAWTGDATLAPLGGDDRIRVELNKASGARIHIDGSSGTDTLDVYGTSQRENLILDTDTHLSGGLAQLHQVTDTGSDLVVVDYTAVEAVNVNTLGGGDRIGVRALNVVTHIDAGQGDDQIAVGTHAGMSSTTASWPNSGGVAGQIQAALFIEGGSGPAAQTGVDQLTVDDTADGTGHPSVTDILTSSTLNGLGMAAAGITYTGFESLAIALGTGNDVFRIDSTHSGPVRPTDLNTGDGNDTVIIRSISGPLSVETGVGDDTVHVSSDITGAGGNLAGIQSLLTLAAGTGGSDQLFVDDSGSSTGRISALTGTSLTGAGMSVAGSAPLPSLVQVVTVSGANTGRFTLVVGGVTTVRLDFDATPAKVRAALQAALETARGVAAGTYANDVLVTRAGNRWVITYTGPLAGAVGRALPITFGDTSQLGGVGTVTTTIDAMTDGELDYTGFEALDLKLSTGNDVLNVNSTITGATTIAADAGNDYLFVEETDGATTIDGNAGDDWLLVNPVEILGEANVLHGRLTLDGGAGSDTYIVEIFGNGNSRVDVTDAGVGADTNVLIVNGSSGDDTFVLRAGLIAAVSARDSFGLFHAAEKVTYDDGINGSVLVNGNAGDDAFALDDNSTSMTINGGSGNDLFRVGQLFTAYTADAEFPAGSFVPTTRGDLSPGVTFSTTINGGSGDDIFAVFHNLAPLQLNGDAGDDTFIIRTFLNVSENTRLNSGSGRDLIQYVINAPVSIDGGDGYDTVVVVGTEQADTFVITSDGVYGAGRFVSYVNVERLIVDGQEGNDHFYVQSTSASVETHIVGGLGSDTVEVAGHAPTVQANDFLGYTGLVLHSVENSPAKWNGIPVDGIAPEIVDNDAPGLVFSPAAGTGPVTVAEGNGTGSSWTVRLAKQPTTSVELTFTAPAVDPTNPTRSRAVELSADGGATWQTTATIDFSTTDWSSPKTLKVRAFGGTTNDDLSSEGERTYQVQVRVVGFTPTLRGTGEYNTLPVANLPVQVLDNDQAGITQVIAAGGLHAVEGTAAQHGESASYTVQLNRAPISGHPVTVTVSTDTAAGHVYFGSGASAVPLATTKTLTFSYGGALSQTVTVWSPDDGIVEGFHFSYLTTTVSSSDTFTGRATATSDVSDELLIQSLGLTTPDLRGYQVKITGGTGAGQTRFIYANTNTSLDVEGDWDVIPDATSTYAIVGFNSPVAPPATAANSTLLPGEIAGNVTAISGDAKTITLSGVTLPIDRGGLTGAIVRIVDGNGAGQFRTIAYNDGSTITVTDPWTTSGSGSVMALNVRVAVLEIPGVLVPRISVNVADANTPGVVVIQSDGTTRLVEGGATDTYTLRLSQAVTGTDTVRVNVTPTATDTALGNTRTGTAVHVQISGITGSGVNHDTTTGQWYVVFTANDWWQERTVTLQAADDTSVEGSDLQAFAPVARRANVVQGPVFVYGGFDPTVGIDLSLDNYLPILLPNESSGHPTPPALPTVNADESKQVDRLIVHNEDDPSAEQATITSTRVTGLGMSPDSVVAGRRLDGGITYHDLEDVQLLLGYGTDNVTVSSTHNGTTEIYGGAANDTFSVNTLSGHTAIYGQAGDDVVHIGRPQNSGQTMSDIAALLAIDGGSGYDSVYADDSGDTAALDMLLTSTSLTGMELTGRAGLDRTYVLQVGSGVGTITFVIAGVGYVNVDTTGLTGDALATAIQDALDQLLFPPVNPFGAQEDSFPTGKCGTTQNPAPCAPSVFVWSVGDSSFIIGFRGEVAGPTSPTLQAFDQGAGVVALAQQGDGLQYYGLEVLDVTFGSGNDVANVQGTGAVSKTDLFLGDGNDRVYVSSQANVGLGSLPDFLPGDLSQIGGTLNIDVGTGTQTLMISDEASLIGKTALITDTRSEAIAADGRTAAGTGDVRMTSSNELANADIYVVGLAGRAITYTAASAGTFAGGIWMWGGHGDDNITVDGTHDRRSLGVRTVTFLNTGLGNDTVTATLSQLDDDLLVLDTQGQYQQNVDTIPLYGGDDVRPADVVTGVSIGTTPIALGTFFGNAAQGSIGLFASPVYQNGGWLDTTVTISRTLVEIQAVTSATDVTLTTPLLDGDVVTATVNGLPVAVHLSGRTLTFTGGAVTGLVVVHIVRVLSFTSSGPQTTDPDNDTVNAQLSDRPLVIFGGQGDDTLNGGTGGDIVFGDRGRVLWFAPGALGVDGTLSIDQTLLATLEGLAVDVAGHGGHGDKTDGVDGRLFGVATTVDPRIGGNDTITTGSGRDVVFGGAGDDIITTNRGGGADQSDIAIGDHGFVDTVTLDGDASDLDRIWTTDPTLGGNDTITTGAGDDVAIGGVGADTIDGGDGMNIVLGDNGRFTALTNTSVQWGQLALSAGQLKTTDANVGGNDTITTGAGVDVILGGFGDDLVHAGDSGDFVIGDNGSVSWNVVGTALQVLQLTTTYDGLGGVDTIYGQGGQDVLIGGTGGDNIDGGTDKDLIFGDNVSLSRTAATFGDYRSPRYRTLTGSQIYTTIATASTPAGIANVDTSSTTWQLPVGARASWLDFTITLLDHDQTTQDSHPELFGNDHIAGGADDDMIFGELGNDTIQGDGSIDITGTDPCNPSAGPQVVGAYRAAPTGRQQTGDLCVVPSVENYLGNADGEDYIEGGGGSDVIFGGLGRDDIIGGSSNLYSRTQLSQRPDAGDLIFGGAGTQAGRNAYGTGGSSTAYSHGTDSDTIVGDNGDIFRLVGTVNGVYGYLTFNYDLSYTNDTVRLLPRAVTLLDYTPGGPDYVPSNFTNITKSALAGTGYSNTDVWGADEVHGESGDDTVYTGGGNDVVFGDAGDDDLIGGWGNDWISGGTGDDGILGDDGRIFTSRNGLAEPLNGLGTLNAQVSIQTPGSIQSAVIFPAGVLNKYADLTPFALNPGAGDGGSVDQPLFVPKWANDVIFGGLGNDFIHGGSGDDGISGAEALPTSYAPDYNGGLLETDWYHPYNNGGLLGFDSNRGDFKLYDEYNPMRKVTLNADGSLSATSDPTYQWFLNFVVNDTNAPAAPNDANFVTDGSDIVFGDYGNDWLVGGTGNDTLWGGWGNDLLNADDNLDSNGGANDVPDTSASYEDRAVGGAGLDVLIANTGGDRLIDWVGEFNSFLVPFAPFGLATISRQVPPGLYQFLYDLSRGQGADQTLNAGASGGRNGEPFGEVGVVTQKDPQWQDQTGGPRDPQAGNVPGGQRDVLRSANFNNNTLSGFFVDSGSWTVSGGTLQVAAASLGKDAASVFYVDDYLPIYYEILASIASQKPTAGWNANAFIIFDYFGKTDFKFAGVDVSLNKLVMGHRDATGWHYDVQTPMLLQAATYYNMLVAVNGTTVTLTVNGSKALTYTYAARVIDGQSVGLNKGMVGMGSNNAKGSFDNVAVQITPPQVTLDSSTDLTQGTGPLTTPISGTWTSGPAGETGSPAAGGSALLPVQLPNGVTSLASTSWLDLSATLATSGIAGVVFDAYGASDFKYAAIDIPGQRVELGHNDPRRGFVVDAYVSFAGTAGASYSVDVQLQGASASISVNGVFMVSFGYNAGAVDGRAGLFARGSAATFTSLHLRTDDIQFWTATPPPPPPTTVPTLSIDSVSVNEGNSGTTTVTLTVSLSQAPATGTSVSVNWRTADGTATAADGDYAGASGTLTFPAGVATQQIVLTINGDTKVEPTEYFTVVLSSPTGATIGTGTGTGTVRIVNDDLPKVSVSSTSVTEGNAGTVTATLTLTLSAPATTTTSVTWATTDGTATAASGDYIAVAPTTVTFLAGQTQATITITINGDTTYEPNETFTVTLSNPNGLALGTATGTVTITNDDPVPAPSASIGTVSVLEGNKGSQTVLVPVTLSNASTQTVTVIVTMTSLGSATAGSDYQGWSPLTLTLTFAPGVTQQTVSVVVYGDRTAEPDESVVLQLTSATNATLGTTSGGVTIRDDDTRLLATATGPGAGSSMVTRRQADSVLAAAKRIWIAAGVAPSRLAHVRIVIASMTGTDLAQAVGHTIRVDADAAGWGWSTDLRHAVANRMDLLSVLLHELGHVLGYGHAATGVMATTLAPGERDVAVAVLLHGTGTGAARRHLPALQTVPQTVPRTPAVVRAVPAQPSVTDAVTGASADGGSATPTLPLSTLALLALLAMVLVTTRRTVRPRIA
jgi:Ca2+-binding RTX toxin-like protein